MALITFTTCISADERIAPIASVTADPAYGILGSVVTLSGQASTDPEDSALTYSWEFAKVPIGSMVQAEGFKNALPDGSVVTFSPDVVGEYLVALRVYNGVYWSTAASVAVAIRPVLMMSAYQNEVPDGKFIWSYLRDVWDDVEGKELFSSFWSALVQLVGADLLRLYQNDFSKSLKTIQDLYQRRWLSYLPRLNLVAEDCSVYLGNHQAGTNASTVNVGRTCKAILLSDSELVVVEGSTVSPPTGTTLDILYDSLTASNVGEYSVKGLNKTKSGYLLQGTLPTASSDVVAANVSATFDYRSQEWQLSSGLSSVVVGDTIVFHAGPNKGLYRVEGVGVSSLTVGKVPPGFSNAETSTLYKVDIYRPVGVRINVADAATTSSVVVPCARLPSGLYTHSLSALAPGRLITAGTSAGAIVRSYDDDSREERLTIVTADSEEFVSDRVGIPWRSPHTLVSSTTDFEAAGVSTGDVLYVDVERASTSLVATIPLQVVGVHKNTLGFVLSTNPTPPGVVPSVSSDIWGIISKDLKIEGIRVTGEQVEVLGEASTLVIAVRANGFKQAYTNKKLPLPLAMTILGDTYTVKPSHIVRNRFLPVDPYLKSVPYLKEWLVTPTTTVVGGKAKLLQNNAWTDIPRLPISLLENSDFVCDSGIVKMSAHINLGTDVLYVETGSFVDRNIRSGDAVHITYPSILATKGAPYIVQELLSQKELKLRTPIHKVNGLSSITVDLEIHRKSTSNFIRFVPGTFSAKAPAPDTLWAEVSFFDNSPTIENNFGILVGLTKRDLDKVSSTTGYRQAVSGLAYAYTKGPTPVSMRLGAQVLLGLPFAEHKGIIREINSNYRLDLDGIPILGRLLVEDVDGTGTPIGITRIYTYPMNEDAAISGLETSPVTGRLYSVGDYVEAYAPLSKGVEVLDYVSTGTPAIGARLSALHTAQLRVSAAVFTLDELALVSTFLKRLTPAHIAIQMTAVLSKDDYEYVLDSERKKLTLGPGIMDDDVGGSLSQASIFDGRTFGLSPYTFYDDGFYVLRKEGTDLETTSGSPACIIPGGGLTDGVGGPLVEAGDLLVIPSGQNRGNYTIASVTDGSLVIYEPSLTHALSLTTTQKYHIFRLVTPVVCSGTATASAHSNTITVTGSVLGRGVAPGDVLLLEYASKYTRHTIIKVNSSSLIVTPETPAAASLSYVVIRMNHVPAPLAEQVVVTPSAPTNHYCDIAKSVTQGLLEAGDRLKRVDGAEDEYLVLDPDMLYVTPALPDGGCTVRLLKMGRPPDIISLGHVYSSNILDTCDVSLLGDSSEFPGGSYTILKAAPGAGTPVAIDPEGTGILPGDTLTLHAGGNAGVYHIVEVATDKVTISGTFASPDPSSWTVSRRV